MAFISELVTLINKYNIESKSNTPDFILAKYMYRTLAVYNSTINERDKWYGYNSRGVIITKLGED